MNFPINNTNTNSKQSIKSHLFCKFSIYLLVCYCKDYENVHYVQVFPDYKMFNEPKYHYRSTYLGMKPASKLSSKLTDIFELRRMTHPEVIIE